MTDVPAAPPPGGAPPAAPPPAGAGEVAINPNPVNAPQPVGSQAPDAPVGDLKGGKGRPESRRESIQKAFAKAQEADEPRKPPANRTTAKKASDKAATPPATDKEGIDLRQKPPQHREGGRFAKAPAAAQPGDQPAADRQPGQPGQQPAQRQAHKPLPDNAPFRDPPQRMADHAKADWAGAPESVRGEVHRMSQEFDGAYRKLRGDHETMNTIRHFHDMATQHGTTLDRALNNYVSMEQKLRADPIAGLDLIVNNLNLRTSDGRKLDLRDVAYHVLSQSPDQLRMTQQQNQVGAANHQIGQLHQTVETLAQTVQQMQYAQQFGQTRSAVDQFADQHPRFDELGDLIEQELRYGFSLEQAYQRAELLRPSTRAAQTRDNPSAQTRNDDRSISGAPGGSSNDSRVGSGKKVGRREAIQRAIQRVNGSV